MTAQSWIQPRVPYYVQTGGMHENPFGVPLDEIVRFCVDNPPEVAAQVVFGKHVESSGLVFSSQIVQPFFDHSLPNVLGQFWSSKEALLRAAMLRPTYYRHRSPFYTGVDFARKTDYTVITTIDTSVSPARVVYYKRLNRVPWETIYTEVGKAAHLWGPNILADSTGFGGDVVMDALEARNFCPQHQRTVMVGSTCMDAAMLPLDCQTNLYLPLACVDPYDFNGGRKEQLIEHLRLCLGQGQDPMRPELPFGLLRCPPIAQLEEELSFYVWLDKGLETDCVMSLGLAAMAGLEDVAGAPAVGSVHGD